MSYRGTTPVREELKWRRHFSFPEFQAALLSDAIVHGVKARAPFKRRPRSGNHRAPTVYAYDFLLFSLKRPRDVYVVAERQYLQLKHYGS